MTSLLAALRPIDAFPMVDQMHAFTAALAGRAGVVVREVGRSRNGDAIQLVSIEAPDSRGDVLVVGQPHPNEPIGMATIMAMCDRLLDDPGALAATRANWHFV